VKNLAFLSLDQRGDFVIDDEHAVAPLADLGWNVFTVSWRQVESRWSDFDAVVIRSTWDYWHDVPAFLDTLATIDRVSRLANPLGLVRWNLEKTYLQDLEDRGVAIVPTLWLNGLSPSELPRLEARLGCSDLVIKPTVGANGDDAFRLSAKDDEARVAQIASRFEGRACMVQPFRQRVLEEGEFSLFYFGGHYSHAIRKVPAEGEFRSQEERGARVLAVEPETGLGRSAEGALAALPLKPLYARVDLVRNESGVFEIMECELVEPSLYLRCDPHAPGRFARAIDRWFDNG
jgi:glutathione synthase/RimK-type ligase-like ATP-grasp enzyme